MRIALFSLPAYVLVVLVLPLSRGLWPLVETLVYPIVTDVVSSLQNPQLGQPPEPRTETCG